MLLPSMEYLESGTTHAFRWCSINIKRNSNYVFYTLKIEVDQPFSEFFNIKLLTNSISINS